MIEQSTKEIFDQCVELAKEMVRPHLRTYDDYMTEQEWEVAIILFTHALEHE